MDRNCSITIKVSPLNVLHRLSPGIRKQMWRVNGLLVLNAILIGVVVGVGAYAPWYRRHPVIGALFLGATTLFLPTISSVVSTFSSTRSLLNTVLGSLRNSEKPDDDVFCNWNSGLVSVLTGLVVVIGINATVVVAGDSREGRNVDPPIILVIKTIWAAYLIISSLLNYIADPMVQAIYDQLLVIMFTKLIFKYFTFYKARQSFAFGRIPRLIAGYMAQLQLRESNYTPHDQQVDNWHAAPAPPALIVMGEDTVKVEKQPYGYSFRTRTNSSNRLVTLDRVLRLNDMNMLQSSVARPKDLCLSFALFKMLRCRFAKYTVHEAGFMKAHKFFRDALINKGADYERVFRVIADELSFIHDYYFSSLPIYYSHHLLLPILSIALSLYTIAYCLFLAIVILQLTPGRPQVYCKLWCNGVYHEPFHAGASLFVTVPTLWVLAVLMLAETRDIISYICSNWTKVALICHYINEASWQQSLAVQKHIGLVLKYCRCKLVNSWDDKLKQCSILVLTPENKTPLLRLRRLLRLPDRKVKVQGAVKAAIFEALKGEDLTCDQEGPLEQHIRPPSSPISGSAAAEVGGSSQLACDCRHPAYTMLAWHVATIVFEARHPQPSDPKGHKIAAIHLSRYCAYLVTYCPELLPGDDEWCRSLYSGVKKDADRVLSAAPGAEYQRLVELLSAENNHEVLKHGAKLGKQLVDSKAGWEALARFWSEMILYVAPSENLEGHAEAIARGGELITLLWALLAHAGIVGRLDADTAAATSDAGHV